MVEGSSNKFDIEINEAFPSNYQSLKKNLMIRQAQEELFIDGTLATEFIIKRLVLVSRKTKKMVEFHATANSNKFSFQLNLPDIAISTEISNDYLDLYLEVQICREQYNKLDLQLIPTHLRDKIQFDEKSISRFLIRLGEFEKTSIAGVHTIFANSDPLRVYFTKKNNLSIALNKEYSKNPGIKMENIMITRDSIQLEGSFFTRNSAAATAEIVMVGRDLNYDISFPINSFQENLENEQYFGLKSYNFSTEIYFKKAKSDLKFYEDIYDVYLKLVLINDEKPVFVRLSAHNQSATSLFKGCSFFKNKHNGYIISPHVTHGKGNLSLVVTELEIGAYRFLQLMMKCSWLLRPLLAQKHVWIVGELSYKAQDTGFHFFKYMREKHPKRNVYYVIDENSQELKNVEPYGNILYSKSMKHIFYTLMATTIVCSHHPEYIYPIRSKVFKALVKAQKVFLQHGIMGTRNSVHYYGVDSANFETDMFIVSSEFEKNMIVNDFGYEPNQVKVTGLSRFDLLFDDNVNLKRQLIIIPTWREWLTKEAGFLKSEYFQRYQKLISNPRLHELSERYQFEIIFCLHPNMQKYSKYFQQAGVKIINQGESDVQFLLKESMIMITDYSSVAFDFSFLNKPSLYYQFDRVKFIGERGSHLDLAKDLPGPIANNEAKLIDLLEEYGKTDFEINPKYKKRAEKFLKYKDQKASKRIFKAISEKEKF